MNAEVVRRRISSHRDAIVSKQDEVASVDVNELALGLDGDVLVSPISKVEEVFFFGLRCTENQERGTLSGCVAQPQVQTRSVPLKSLQSMPSTSLIY